MLVLWLQGFFHLMVGVPVKACDQVLVVLFACQSVDPLLFGFVCESAFDLPPGALECDLPGSRSCDSGLVYLMSSEACRPHSCRYTMVAAMGPRTVYHGCCLV